MSLTDQLIIPKESSVPFLIENQLVLLIDDVNYTGRTTRSAMEALFEIGRQKWNNLLVVINRQVEKEISYRIKKG